MLETICFSCQKPLKFSDRKISFREECPHCRSDIHVCKNCSHYDANVYNECKETSADVVREKERSNYCDFFELALGKTAQLDKAAALKAAADALFKKS